MEYFNDKTGKQWKIEVDLAAAERVRAGMNVDILDTAEDGVVYTLMDDLLLTANILYFVCKEEADQAKLTQEQFWSCLNGDSIVEGAKKLWSEIEVFFPQDKRATFKAHIARLISNRQRAEQLAEKVLTGPEMDQWVDDRFEKVESATAEVLQGKRSLSSLQSLVETLGDSASENST